MKFQTRIPDSVPVTPLAAAVAQLQVVTHQSLGQAHNSLGVRKAKKGQLKEAVSHFSEGSKVGFSKATFNLAVCYEQGRGVTQDLEKVHLQNFCVIRYCINLISMLQSKASLVNVVI